VAPPQRQSTAQRPKEIVHGGLLFEVSDDLPAFLLEPKQEASASREASAETVAQNVQPAPASSRSARRSALLDGLGRWMSRLLLAFAAATAVIGAMTHHPGTAQWNVLHMPAAQLTGLWAVLTALVIFLRESRTPVNVLALSGVTLVMMQILLGSACEILQLDWLWRVAHALLGWLFVCAAAAIAYSQSTERARRTRNPEEAHSALLLYSAAAMIVVMAGAFATAALAQQWEAGFMTAAAPAADGRILPSASQEALAWVNAWREAFGEAAGVELGTISQRQLLVHELSRWSGLALLIAALIWTAAVRRQARGNKRYMSAVYALDILIAGYAATSFWAAMSVRAALPAAAQWVLGVAALSICAVLTLRAAPTRNRRV
jgi:heme A synthase